MGSLALAVIDVLPKNQLQVSLAEDQQPVQGFVAQSLDHPLAMRVGSRAPVRREGDPGAFAAEHLIELVDELSIPIMDGGSGSRVGYPRKRARWTKPPRFRERGAGGAQIPRPRPVSNL